MQELNNTKLLIIGAGSIGQAIAVRANAFGMQVWGSCRSPQPLPGFERVVGVDEWRSLLPEVDYVVVATPLTPETKGMIDAFVLRSMQSSAYLINIARGAVVDETALLLALKEAGLLVLDLIPSAQNRCLQTAHSGLCPMPLLHLTVQLLLLKQSGVLSIYFLIT